MNRDAPLIALAAGALASYPAIALSWCVTALVSTRPEAREMWQSHQPAALAALALVVVAGIAVGNAGRVVVRGLRQTRRFQAWFAPLRIQPTGEVSRVAGELGLDGRLWVVNVREPLAVTVGLSRPYVVLSNGLVAELPPVQLRAVLAHEHAHVRRRDPLRLLVGRVLAAHLWWLPVATALRGRARWGYELAADRHAVRYYGTSAVAGALLRVVTPPVSAPPFAAQFAEAGLLEARVAQLEAGHPPRPPVISTRRAAATVAAALAFASAVIAAWLVMLLTCPCLM